MSWSAYIRSVIINVRIVDNRGAVVYVDPIARWRVITVDVLAHHITLRQEYPVMGRDTDVDMDSHAWSQWSPAVISASASPAYPGRSPFVSGHPSPSVIVVVYPSAVMERRPSPAVIGNPGVAVVGHCPITITHVWLESWACIGDPDISMFVIINPIAMRRQFVIKYLKRNAHAGLGFCGFDSSEYDKRNRGKNK